MIKPVPQFRIAPPIVAGDRIDRHFKRTIQQFNEDVTNLNEAEAVNIDRTADEIRESFERVYERVQAAKYDRAESVEISRQEAFDLFHRLETYDVNTGARTTGGVNMSDIEVGMRGAVIGFPCVIVDTLTSPVLPAPLENQ